MRGLGAVKDRKGRLIGVFLLVRREGVVLVMDAALMRPVERSLWN